MNKVELQQRTRVFVLRVLRMCAGLPHTDLSRIISKHVMRSATSVGANYRAACRARSKADILSKINIVEEESDETHGWLELLVDSKLVPESRMQDLLREANELTAIFAASGRTARMNMRRVGNSRSMRLDEPHRAQGKPTD